MMQYQCYCWISPEYWYIIISIYLFFWICLFVNAYMLIMIIKFLRNFRENYGQADSEYMTIIKNIISKLYKLPIITFFMWFSATINRVYELSCQLWNENHKIEQSNIVESRIILYTLQALIMSSRGVIYFLIYCRYTTINDQLYKMINKICCRKRSIDITEIQEILI